MLQKMKRMLRQSKETAPFWKQIEISLDQIKFCQIQFKIILLKLNQVKFKLNYVE